MNKTLQTVAACALLAVGCSQAPAPTADSPAPLQGTFTPGTPMAGAPAPAPTDAGHVPAPQSPPDAGAVVDPAPPADAGAVVEPVVDAQVHDLQDVGPDADTPDNADSGADTPDNADSGADTPDNADSGADMSDAGDPPVEDAAVEPQPVACSDLAPGTPGPAFVPALDCAGTAPCTGALSPDDSHTGEAWCDWHTTDGNLGTCTNATLWGWDVPSCTVPQWKCAVAAGPGWCVRQVSPGATLSTVGRAPAEPGWVVSMVAPLVDGECTLQCPELP